MPSFFQINLTSISVFLLCHFASIQTFPSNISENSSRYSSVSIEDVTSCPDQLKIGSMVTPEKFRNICHLTLHWGLEAIGADLSKTFLLSIKDLQPKGIGVIDSGSFPENLEALKNKNTYYQVDPTHISIFSPEHSKLVTNLIFNSELGSSALAYLGAFVAFEGDSLLNSISKNILDSQTDVINISVELKESIILKENINTLLRGNKTLVIAAGNKYPRELEKTLEAKNLIIVGAMDPTGLVSSYSVHSPLVDILAPAGYELPSTKDGITYTLFNGTSAAAPLVSGVLGDLLSLLPQLSLNNQELLIKATALPLPSNTTGKDGAGLLNAYKIIRCADRLRQAPLNGKPLTPQILNLTCNFSKEALELKEQGINQFKKLNMKSFDKLNLISLLNQFRKSLLLDFDPETASYLSTGYQMLGYSTNAQFYRTLGSRAEDLFDNVYHTPTPFMKFVFKNEASPLQVINGNLFRYASRFSKSSKIFKKSLRLINKLSNNGRKSDLQKSMQYSYLLERDGSQILKNTRNQVDLESFWIEALTIEMDLISSSGYLWNKIESIFKFALSPYKKVREQFYQMAPYQLMEYFNTHIELQYGKTKSARAFEATVEKLKSLASAESDVELKKMALQKIEDADLN